MLSFDRREQYRNSVRGSVVLVWILAACTAPNPKYCDETRACSNGQACDLTTHTCTDRAADAGVADPVVVSTVPANNAIGVMPDATIEITFSQPMNKSSVEEAWTSADLPASGVTFSWNAASDKLTAMPNQVLPVATGTGLDPNAVPPIEIAYAITTDATDTAGRPLRSQLSARFKTIRRFAHNAALLESLTQNVANDNTVISPPSTYPGVGDFVQANTYQRFFVAFTLPTLPAGAQLEHAEFSAQQANVQGTPYAHFGNMKAQHVNFASFDTTTFNAVPFASLNDFSTNATLEVKSLDVTERVVDDYANAAARGSRSQYRLEFPIGTNNDGVRDSAAFLRTSLALRLTYTVP